MLFLSVFSGFSNKYTVFLEFILLYERQTHSASLIIIFHSIFKRYKQFYFCNLLTNIYVYRLSCLFINVNMCIHCSKTIHINLIAFVSVVDTNYLNQANNPSIEYKYVVKAIVPKDNRWWRRGTHRLYADISEPKIIQA